MWLGSRQQQTMGPTSVRFGSIEVQTEARQLLVDGVPAKLGSRAFDLLLALIERRDRVVGKDELLGLVWPGLVVEENNLQVHVSALRKVLGSQAVATIPGRGYRFAAALADDAPSAPESTQLAASPPSQSSSQVPSIAVLPFRNMGADTEDYLSDGITEDIITELSRWRSLAVTSRYSSFRFKGQAVDAQQLGGELGVRFIVEGSVRRMGDRIRVTAQLTDAENGNTVWGERYDRPIVDLFAVQDEVVHTIVGTLVGRVQVSTAERARRKPPASLDAYDLTLRGNALLWDEPASAAEAVFLTACCRRFSPANGSAANRVPSRRWIARLRWRSVPSNWPTTKAPVTRCWDRCTSNADRSIWRYATPSVA